MQRIFMQIYTSVIKQLLIAAIGFMYAAMLHAQEQSTPEWAAEVVWYQIFPDRFRNGDTSNDPTLDDIKGCWPHNDTAAWEVMPWISDWYAMQPWEQANGQDIWYNMQRRRYGGDLQGIIDKLPYLDSLGVGAIYLNPVFMAPSLHKYDAAMYHHIEPTFGPDPEGDKKLIAQEDPADPSTWQWTSADKLALQLIDACHQRGMRIIFDGVFNHMGVNSFAFQDVVKNQLASPYKDWFVIDSWYDPAAGTKFSYTGWFNAPDLPEFKEDSLGIVSGPRDYIYACTKRWMAPNGNVAYGIDGWRLDVAFCVDMDFWHAWSGFVKSINREAYLTAEINANEQDVLPYIKNGPFDAVMHYGFAVLAYEFFIQRNEGISASELNRKLQELRALYGDGVSYAMMNLLDSHDTPRFTSCLHNPDVGAFRTWGDFFNATRATNKAFDTGKPSDLEYQKQKLMALLQFTYVGAPMIYYGDEAGMWGANDPDCRKPMIWSDLTYAPERILPDQQTKQKVDSVAVEEELLTYYRALGHMRKQSRALQSGYFLGAFTHDKKGLFSFQRAVENEMVEVIINNSSRTRKLRIQYAEHDTHCVYINLLTGEQLTQGERGIKYVLPPYTGIAVQRKCMQAQD